MISGEFGGQILYPSSMYQRRAKCKAWTHVALDRWIHRWTRVSVPAARWLCLCSFKRHSNEIFQFVQQGIIVSTLASVGSPQTRRYLRAAWFDLQSAGVRPQSALWFHPTTHRFSPDARQNPSFLVELFPSSQSFLPFKHSAGPGGNPICCKPFLSSKVPLGRTSLYLRELWEGYNGPGL